MAIGLPIKARSMNGAESELLNPQAPAPMCNTQRHSGLHQRTAALVEPIGPIQNAHRGIVMKVRSDYVRFVPGTVLILDPRPRVLERIKDVMDVNNHARP